MIIVYVAAVDQRPFFEFVKDYVPFMGFLTLYAVYGHLINDYSDRELDRLAGKTRLIGQLSDSVAKGLVISTLILGVLVALPLFMHPYFVPLLISAYFLTTFYSLPPIRFKERGLLGIVTVTFAEDVLSVMLIFSSLGHFTFIDTLLFTLYQVGFGVKEIAKHQVKDLDMDTKVGITTFAKEKGKTKAWKLFVGMYALERLVLMSILVWMSLQLFPVMALLFSYVAANGFLLFYRKKTRGYRDLLPEALSGEGKTLGYIYPRLLIPLFLIIFTIGDPILLSTLLVVTWVWTHKLALSVLRELRNFLMNLSFPSRKTYVDSHNLSSVDHCQRGFRQMGFRQMV